MKLARDLAIIAITAVLAAPFARPRIASAEEDRRAPVPAAVLDLDGVRVTLVTKPGAAGKEAVATLTAVNRGDAAAKRTVPVRLLVTRKPDPRARMLAAPQEKWTHAVSLDLAANETKTVDLRTGVKLAEGESALFVAGQDRRTIVERLSAKPAAADRRRAP